MSGIQLVKTGRQAGAGVTASGNTSSTTMSDATARAIRRSREQFVADMRKLLSEARRYLGDVCWRLDGDDELIYGHRGELGMTIKHINKL